MAFKENLTHLRKSMNLSQEELAEKLNVSRQAISKWENGQSTPDLETILALCKLFNVTTDQLLISLDNNIKSDESQNNNNNEKGNRVLLILCLVFLILICLCGFIVFILNLFFTDYMDIGIHNFSLLLISISFSLFIIVLLISIIRNHFKKKK